MKFAHSTFGRDKPANEHCPFVSLEGIPFSWHYGTRTGTVLRAAKIVSWEDWVYTTAAAGKRRCIRVVVSAKPQWWRGHVSVDLQVHGCGPQLCLNSVCKYCINTSHFQCSKIHKKIRIKNLQKTFSCFSLVVKATSQPLILPLLVNNRFYFRRLLTLTIFLLTSYLLSSTPA